MPKKTIKQLLEQARADPTSLTPAELREVRKLQRKATPDDDYTTDDDDGDAGLRRDNGWFGRTQAAAFLGVGADYFDKNVRPFLDRADTRKNSQGRVQVYGRGVVEVVLRRRLEQQAKSIGVSSDDADLFVGPDGPHVERWQKARADKLEIEVAEKRSILVPRDAMRSGLAKVAALLRDFGDQLQKRHGAEAHRLLEETLSEVERVIQEDPVIGDADSPKPGD